MNFNVYLFLSEEYVDWINPINYQCFRVVCESNQWRKIILMKCDVVVIGGGVIGLATATQLLLKGAKVTILERNRVGSESSWAGGGILSPIYPWSYPAAINRLCEYSNQLFPAWVSYLTNLSGVDPEYVVSGMRILSFPDRNKIENWCGEYNVKMKYSPISEAYLFSAEFEHQNILNQADNLSIFLPEIAQVRNPQLLKALHKTLLKLGGGIIENCDVKTLSVSNHKVSTLITSHGQVQADDYVVCAGAWSKELLGEHASELDVKPIKGEMLLFKFVTSPIANVLVKEDVYIIPRKDGFLIVGSTLEDVGFDKKITINARNYLYHKAQELLPVLKGMPIIKQWAGLRPFSEKAFPYIGRHSSISNLFINTGHFRYGIAMAPASAEILVNEIIRQPQKIDINPYLP